MENINGVIYKDISIDKNISTKRVICVNVANATLSIALGSAYELETETVLAHNFGYVSDEEYGDITKVIVEVQKMLYNLMSKFNKQ
ncbi:MAG: four helix bundle protein [Paludibacteraceae bacterium]|nr:four helix bundle protein [Paludibacteraceae bacterium]